VRGSVVGLCATALATAGHALEGSPAPALPVIACLAVAAVLVSIALSRVRWGLRSLLVVLVAAQLIFHVALAGLVAAAEILGGPAGISGVGDTGVSWSKLAAHLAAALLTAVVLRRGEDACWRIADILARAARAVGAVAVGAPVVAPAARWVLGGGNRSSGRYLWQIAPRRGPPVRFRTA
jgi:hypothetical protein